MIQFHQYVIMKQIQHRTVHTTLSVPVEVYGHPRRSCQFFIGQGMSPGQQDWDKLVVGSKRISNVMALWVDDPKNFPFTELVIINYCRLCQLLRESTSNCIGLSLKGSFIKQPIIN